MGGYSIWYWISTLRVSLGWSVIGQRRMPFESGLASGLIFTPLMTISRSSETGMRSARVNVTGLAERFSAVTTNASCISVRCLRTSALCFRSSVRESLSCSATLRNREKDSPPATKSTLVMPTNAPSW